MDMQKPLLLIALFAGCLLLVGWSKLDQAPKVRWEYKMISATTSTLPFQWYEDGQKAADIKIHPKANQLGAEGWEMVSFESDSGLIIYWFKRPIP